MSADEDTGNEREGRGTLDGRGIADDRGSCLFDTSILCGHVKFKHDPVDRKIVSAASKLIAIPL